MELREVFEKASSFFLAGTLRSVTSIIRGSRDESSSREKSLLDTESAPFPRDVGMPFNESLFNGVILLAKPYFLKKIELGTRM